MTKKMKNENVAGELLFAKKGDKVISKKVAADHWSAIKWIMSVQF